MEDMMEMDDQVAMGINDSSGSSRKKSLPSKLLPNSSDKKKVQCHECGFTCSSYAQLKVHHRIHTGDKPYACPQCNYASTRNANLQRHIASMHAGHYSSLATGKRSWPQNMPQMMDSINQVSSILSHKDNFGSLSGNPNTKRHFVDSAKSPLSEIRAREFMLAENVVQHDPGIVKELTQSTIEGGLKACLLHPASQVLALPPHIPLTQESSSSSFNSNSMLQEPILIENNPSSDDESGPKHLFENAELHTEVQQQMQLDETVVISPKDKILADRQQSPMLIETNVTRAKSSSPEIIPIDLPATSLDNERSSRFTCIVNNGLNMPKVSHALEVEKSLSPVNPVISSSVAFQAMPESTSVGGLTTKFNQRQPLVLEIENSSIGLYLHLDLSKYLCETARDWLSQHTLHCNGMCRANFPVQTSNATMPALPVESDLGQKHMDILPSQPLHTSMKVPTILKASSISETQARAFPTAILAVPHTLQIGNCNDAQPPSMQNNFAITKESNPSAITSPKFCRSETNQAIPQSLPAMLNPTEHTDSGSIIHEHIEKQTQQTLVGSVEDTELPQVPNSLIFQRWPALKQYMQVRSMTSNQQEFSCYKCGKQFAQLHQLKVHVKNHIKRYNCMQCHYSTHRMANLRRHQMTHRQINELTCHLCNAVMANKRAYTMHILFAHKKQRKSKDFDTWRKQFGVPKTNRHSIPGDFTESSNMESTVRTLPDLNNLLDANQPETKVDVANHEASVAEIELVQGGEATASSSSIHTEVTNTEPSSPLKPHNNQKTEVEVNDNHGNSSPSNQDVVIKEEEQGYPAEDDMKIMDSEADGGKSTGDISVKEEMPNVMDLEDTDELANQSKDTTEKTDQTTNHRCCSIMEG